MGENGSTAVKTPAAAKATSSNGLKKTADIIGGKKSGAQPRDYVVVEERDIDGLLVLVPVAFVKARTNDEACWKAVDGNTDLETRSKGETPPKLAAVAKSKLPQAKAYKQTPRSDFIRSAA